MAIDLNSKAVGQKTEQDALEILQLYIETAPSMAMNHAPAEPAVAPGGMNAAGSIDPMKR